MSNLALAALFAVFIWWFSTGIVLLLNRMSRTAVRWSLGLSTLLSAAALMALAHTAQQTTVASVYCAFTCALLVWGWNELTFLTGWITGPRTTAITADLPEGQRFVQAVRAILWHELGILAVGLVIVAITWKAPNQIGTWTFMVLWAMRISAKLNLFFGVRNLSEQFLPPHLAYLESFFRRKPINLFFPLAVAAASIVLTLVVKRALDPNLDEAQATGLALVGSLLALAILEHWLLILPIDATALWRWAVKKPNIALTAKAAQTSNSGSSQPAGASAPGSESNPPHEKLLHAR
jgi:putative photosynthetic complex assembly protein 2